MRNLGFSTDHAKHQLFLATTLHMLPLIRNGVSPDCIKCCFNHNTAVGHVSLSMGHVSLSMECLEGAQGTRRQASVPLHKHGGGTGCHSAASQEWIRGAAPRNCIAAALLHGVQLQVGHRLGPGHPVRQHAPVEHHQERPEVGIGDALRLVVGGGGGGAGDQHPHHPRCGVFVVERHLRAWSRGTQLRVQTVQGPKILSSGVQAIGNTRHKNPL